MKHFKTGHCLRERLSERALLIWVIAGCLLPNVLLSFTERMPLFQSLTNVVLPLGIYALLMSVTRRIGRATLWMTVLFVFAAFQLVLLYMYGRSVIAVDMFLNVVTTNPAEVNELLGNLVVVLLFAVALYLPPIVAAVVAVCRKWRLTLQEQHFTRNAGLVCVAVGLITMGCGLLENRRYHPVDDIYPVNIAYNLVTAVVRTGKVIRYHDTSASFSYHAETTRADTVREVYVLVIGETGRAGNWQLFGYRRPTTPALTGREGLVGFGRAISQSNTTHKSVPMLLSHLDACTFTDSIYRVKGLIAAFAEAGFATAYISNQSRNHSLIDFFGEEADTSVFLADIPRTDGMHHYDDELIGPMTEILAQGNPKQLMVLHCYGSHFSYIDRYRPEHTVFTPDRPASATVHFKDKQINAYDNTIHYTSEFIAQVLNTLERYPGQKALLYTSDHGEDIFDDERNLFLHASPVPSYYQLHVPLIVWADSTFRAAYPAMMDALRANSDKFVAPSKAFFHTVMQLAGIRTPYATEAYSVASHDYRPERAMYLNDHNEGVPLIESGILDYDIKCLDSLSIPMY